MVSFSNSLTREEAHSIATFLDTPAYHSKKQHWRLAMTRPKILPPVYFVLSIGLIAVMHYSMPIYRIFQTPLNLCGLGLVVVGIAISAYGSGQFKKAGTPVVPFEQSTTLVTTGLYRITRNPMYLGLVIALIGIAIVSGTAGAFLPVLIFISIIDVRFIQQEEHFLEVLFGDSYREYRQSVRRWF
jgi:protein-S-isoprenylcysteine O-methyltransferase Ste14